MWKSLIKLEFLKNEHDKVGLVRLATFLYFLTFFAAIFKSGLSDISLNWVYMAIVMLVAVIGEKIYPYITKWINAWKGDSNV